MACKDCHYVNTEMADRFYAQWWYTIICKRYLIDFANFSFLYLCFFFFSFLIVLSLQRKSLLHHDSRNIHYCAPSVSSHRFYRLSCFLVRPKEKMRLESHNMKGGAPLSPFPALSFLDSKNVPPVGIWCQTDVVSTSMRRHHVASTLIRRHFTSCARWAIYCCVGRVFQSPVDPSRDSNLRLSAL